MNTTATAKVTQYLIEAETEERAAAGVLDAHIALTPSGSYRSILEQQRIQSKRHGERIQRRLRDLGSHRGPAGVLEDSIGTLSGLWGKAISVGTAPLNLLRGRGGEEKMLKNAKDQAAVFERGIFTYRVLEHLAQSVGDADTAKLAGSICEEKLQGLERLDGALDGLVDAVVRSEVKGQNVYNLSTTGAAQSARRFAREAQDGAEALGDDVKSQARQTRKIPGVARVEGGLKGALADEEDLPIANYDELTAADITSKLDSLSQIDLTKVDVYERKNANRSTITDRISSLRSEEPWPGYDDQNVAQIRKHLMGAEDQLVHEVRVYEGRHKDRQGVLDATEKVLTAN